MRTLTVVSLMFVAGASAVRAQAVVDPGMTREQVIATLGRPGHERTADSSTFFFYSNGHERRVGMNDIVVFANGKVVDAIFRSGARRFSGSSSSPAAIPPEVARKQHAPPGAELRTGAPAKKP